MHDFNDSPAQNHISKHTGSITKMYLHVQVIIKKRVQKLFKNFKKLTIS